MWICASAGHLATHSLYLAPDIFSFQSPFLRAPGRFGCSARRWQYRDAGNDFIESAHGLFFVLWLAAVGLRLDNENAVPRDALVIQTEQPLLDVIRQRRCPDVKAQMDGTRYLVDILAAGALCANGADVEFVVGDEKEFQWIISVRQSWCDDALRSPAF